MWLSRSKSLIQHRLQQEAFSKLSIENQLRVLRAADSGFEMINRETYRKFLIRSKLAVYRSFVVKARIALDTDNQLRRVVVLRFLLEFLKGPYHVLYFDISTVGPSSFRHKAWVSPTGVAVFRQKQSLKPVKLYACLSVDGIESIRIFNHSSGETIAQFLRHSIYCQQLKNCKERLVVFLDNATSNRTREIMDLANDYVLILLYNAVETPIFNIAEGFFEWAKRDLRVRSFESDYETVTFLIERARTFKKAQLARLVCKEASKVWKIFCQGQQSQ